MKVPKKPEGACRNLKYKILCMALISLVAFTDRAESSEPAAQPDSVELDVTINGMLKHDEYTNEDCGTGSFSFKWHGNLKRSRSDPDHLYPAASFQAESSTPKLNASNYKCGTDESDSRTYHFEQNPNAYLMIELGLQKEFVPIGSSGGAIDTPALAVTIFDAGKWASTGWGGDTGPSNTGPCYLLTAGPEALGLTPEDFRKGFTKEYPIPDITLQCGADYTAGGHITLRYKSDEIKVELKSLKFDNPHCSCTDAPVEFTATANDKDGEFEEFKVESSGKKPEIVTNKGGKSPRLVLKGSGKETGKTSITAVYKKENKTYKGEPFEMNFCDIQKPKFGPNEFNLPLLAPNLDSFLFSEDNPGRVEIEAYIKDAWLNGQKLEETLEWEISPDNGMFKKEPYENKKRIKFKAGALPEKNSDFGKKKIKAAFKNDACYCESENIEAILFFPLAAKNNPEGKAPNWAYYWRQTSAGQGIPFETVKTLPPNPDDPNSYPNAVGRYDYHRGKIFFLDNMMTMVAPCVPCSQGGQDPKGIDCFANLLRHENQHKKELSGWWGPNFKGYSRLNDLDGDLIPNEVEERMGCSPIFPFSCPTRPTWLGTVSDIEFDSYAVGCSWPVGSADKEDWACPGKQCP